MSPEVGLIWKTLREMWLSFLTQVPFIALGLAVFAVFVIGAQVVRRLILRTSTRTQLHANLAQLLSRLASAMVTILGVFVAAVVIFPAFKPGDLVAGLGITSVAVGFAFKDILQNFFAGVLILWQEPFAVGDEIRSGAYEGTVQEINIRSTGLKTYDGERVILPNGDVYTSAILVRTAFDRQRVQLTVGVGPVESLERARTLLLEAVAQTPGVLPDPKPAVHIWDLTGGLVNFRVYFWIEPTQAKLLEMGDRVATGIKRALDAAQVECRTIAR